MTLGQAVPLSGQHPGRKLPMLPAANTRDLRRKECFPLPVIWFPVLLSIICIDSFLMLLGKVCFFKSFP